MVKLYFSNDKDFKLMILETKTNSDFDSEFSLEFVFSAGKNIIEKIKKQLQKMAPSFKKGKVKVFRNGVLIFAAFITVGCSIQDNEQLNNHQPSTSVTEETIPIPNIESDAIEEIFITENNFTQTQDEKDAPKIIADVEDNEVIEITEDAPEINTEKSILVSVKRSNGNIEVLDLETYIAGVVAAEMPASFNSEALKAQAVASRTYALKRINLGLMMTDTTATQRYSDQNELKNLWGKNFDYYYQKILSAVKATNDNVITYDGDLIDAVYHSTCNGATEDSFYVWGSTTPYLKSVSSPTDTRSSSYSHTITTSYSQISQKLGVTFTQETDINILSKTANNSVYKIMIGNKAFSGTDVRSKLGLRSTDFNIIKNSDNVVITMKGFGHGVGMSQYGAHGMANDGKNYIQILNHYYSGVELIKYY